MLSCLFRRGAANVFANGARNREILTGQVGRCAPRRQSGRWPTARSVYQHRIELDDLGVGRALSRRARVIVLDEPTATLTSHEVRIPVDLLAVGVRGQGGEQRFRHLTPCVLVARTHERFIVREAFGLRREVRIALGEDDRDARLLGET